MKSKRIKLIAMISAVLLLIAAFVGCDNGKAPSATSGDDSKAVTNQAAVTTRTDEFGKLCVEGYTVPSELFYYTYYKSGDKESDRSFRGGAFNSNSAESSVKAYSPAERLIVPMICVWDYENPPENGYPSYITESDGFISGAANNHSDSWLITNLREDFLPTYADRSAFTELVLPMSLSRIGENAVQDCARLASVRFFDLADSKLQTIEDGAFRNCPLLSYVELPDTLTTIRDDAFLNCPSLTSVTVPESVTVIMQHALGFTTADGNIYTKVPGFTVRGCRDSEAQIYAERCGFTFLAIDAE